MCVCNIDTRIERLYRVIVLPGRKLNVKSENETKILFFEGSNYNLTIYDVSILVDVFEPRRKSIPKGIYLLPDVNPSIFSIVAG